MLEILEQEDEEPTAKTPVSMGIPSGQATPDEVADTVERYFAESEKGHRVNVATTRAYAERAISWYFGPMDRAPIIDSVAQESVQTEGRESVTSS